VAGCQKKRSELLRTVLALYRFRPVGSQRRTKTTADFGLTKRNTSAKSKDCDLSCSSDGSLASRAFHAHVDDSVQGLMLRLLKAKIPGCRTAVLCPAENMKRILRPAKSLFSYDAPKAGMREWPFRAQRNSFPIINLSRLATPCQRSASHAHRSLLAFKHHSQRTRTNRQGASPSRYPSCRVKRLRASCPCTHRQFQAS
jgi:hypothetical protein